MSIVAKLLERKERLLAQLESGPGPNEREEIESMLARRWEPSVAGRVVNKRQTLTPIGFQH